MIQNVLHAMGGIDRYGVVSLLLFATVFAGVIIWTFAQKRADLDRMAQAPLENDSDDSLKG